MTAVLVLMYHRVADPVHDPFGLAVHPDRFAQHVEHLRVLRRVVPLLDWSAPATSPRIALTFDDGYLDSATVAAPALEQAGLPATWFLTSGLVGGSRFWWDVLTDAVLRGTRGRAVDVRVLDRDLWLDLSTPAARHLSLVAVRRRLRPCPPEVVARAVAQVAVACGAPAPEADSRTMSRAQVVELAARPGMEIGAHTRTHLQLGGQTAALQREEVLGSVTDLEQLVGRRVKAFAYPFGARRDIGDLAPRLVAEAGCQVACSTAPGLAARDADPFLLPRLNVEDWDGATFARRVAAALSA